MTTAHTPLVALLNTSPDFIDIMTDLLNMEGFTTVADYIVEFRKGKKDIRAFMTEHQPDVVIYDIAIPYAENWSFFQHVVAVSGLKPCQFILVTTNRNVLNQVIGENRSLEIIGKPFDLDHVIAARRMKLWSYPHCSRSWT